MILFTSYVMSLPRIRSASGVMWLVLVSIYMYTMFVDKKNLNRTLAVDSPLVLPDVLSEKL